MEIKRSGSQPSGKGPAEWFTGTVRIDPLFQAPDSGARCRRQRHLRARRPHGMAHPSARPDPDRDGRLRPGAALGRPDRGDPARRRGLVPPGEKHWHGATPTTAMTHIAIQEQLDGKAVDWMEQVSDEQYQGLGAA